MKELYKSLRTAVSCLALILAPGLLFSQSKRSLTAYPNTVVDDFIHGFYISLPANYDPGKKYPMLLFIHGSGELGDGSTGALPLVLRNGPPMQIDQQVNHNTNANFPDPVTVNGKSYEFIVVAPQLNTWVQGGAAFGALNDMMDYTINHYSVDASKIYLTGLSMGGGISWIYAGNADGAKRLAGLLVIAGAQPADPGSAARMAQEHLPVWATTNLVDPTVDPAATKLWVQYINSDHANPPAIIDTFPDSGHGGWVKTYGAPGQPGITNSAGQNVYQWMAQYTRVGDNVTTVISVPLPVTWGDYKAVRSGPSAVVVSWSTLMEQNNRYFIIQRSTDGQKFDDLDSVNAFNEPHAYSYNDAYPPAGKLFYRLAQVDLDGKYTYSGTMEVELPVDGNKGFRLSPNPTSGPIYLELVNAEQGRLEVSLSDAAGRTLHKWIFEKQGLQWTQPIDPGNLPAGSYFITVKGTSTRVVQSFIKK